MVDQAEITIMIILKGKQTQVWIYNAGQFLKIIQFLKMNEYRISNSTIWSQLFEYWILKIE